MRETRFDDQGFTLVEVLVAMLILTGTAVAAAGLFISSAGSNRIARVETQASMLGAAKMEQLQSLAWEYDSGGAPVSDFSTDVSVEPPTNGGTGLRASPADALDRNRSGFVDYLDAGGRWVGTGLAPSPSATYVRRWSIQPLAQFAADGLVLQVFVTTVGGAQSRPVAANASRGLDAALVAIRSRHAR